MKPAAHTFKLPHERALQLRAITDALGYSTVSETLGALFDLARKQGLVEHEIPGVTINRFPDGIALSFDGVSYVGLSKAGAQELAGTIEAFAAGQNTAKKIVNLDNDFAVFRRGPSIAICVGQDLVEPARVWNDDIAVDFARLLKRELQVA